MLTSVFLRFKTKLGLFVLCRLHKFSTRCSCFLIRFGNGQKGQELDINRATNARRRWHARHRSFRLRRARPATTSRSLPLSSRLWNGNRHKLCFATFSCFSSSRSEMLIGSRDGWVKNRAMTFNEEWNFPFSSSFLTFFIFSFLAPI